MGHAHVGKEYNFLAPGGGFSHHVASGHPLLCQPVVQAWTVYCSSHTDQVCDCAAGGMTLL
jgi:hypothetical protein